MTPAARLRGKATPPASMPPDWSPPWGRSAAPSSRPPPCSAPSSTGAGRSTPWPGPAWKSRGRAGRSKSTAWSSPPGTRRWPPWKSSAARELISGRWPMTWGRPSAAAPTSKPWSAPGAGCSKSRTPFPSRSWRKPSAAGTGNATSTPSTPCCGTTARWSSMKPPRTR